MKHLLVIICLGLAQPVQAGEFLNLFKNKKPIIGVVFISQMIGQGKNIDLDQLTQKTIDQVKILEDEGVDGVLIENSYNNSTDGFSATPEMIASMSIILKKVVESVSDIVVGVEVIWHDPYASFAIAKASGAKFIRTDFFSDKMIADGYVIDENPKEILAYRKLLEAENIVLLTDIQVKYAEMVDKKITIETSAKNARKKGSQGIVVSGAASGKAASVTKVKNAKKGAKSLEVVIGSGFSTKNAKSLLEYADAAIVGTSISTETHGTIVKTKVQELMKVVSDIRSKL